MRVASYEYALGGQEGAILSEWTYLIASTKDVGEGALANLSVARFSEIDRIDGENNDSRYGFVGGATVCH